MGLLAASATKQALIAQKHDLEAKILDIQENKRTLSTSSKDLVNAGSDLDPNSPTYKELQVRKERLDQLEKQLDMELTEYQEQLEMINNNMRLCDEQIKEGIKE